jgi:DNA polymerase III subunit delta
VTAYKVSEVDRFMARPNPSEPVVLVYGPDAGLVRERVDALVKASVDDPNDPFALARIEAEDLSANPSRLVEEANTIPLFGGKRAVLVRAGARNIAGAVEPVLASPSPDCRIIIEAGDLKKSSPLRALCEKAKAAAALPCYADSEVALGKLIDDELRAENLTIAPDARAFLLSLIGGDRLASRNEVRKLALYARGQGKIEHADVVAVVADASSVALDGVLDAAFAGKTGATDTEFDKARADGSSAQAIIGAALRHVANLHKIRVAADAGDSAEFLMKRSGIHFSREKIVGEALRLWNAAKLARAMQQLADAALEARRNARLADAVAQRALLSIATSARRRE